MKKIMKLGEKSIEYKISGDSGEVLVCLPGLGCDLDLFTPFVKNYHQNFNYFKLITEVLEIVSLKIKTTIKLSI